MTPLNGHFWPQSQNLNKFHRGPLDYATCQLRLLVSGGFISTIYKFIVLSVRRVDNGLKLFHYRLTIKMMCISQQQHVDLESESDWECLSCNTTEI